MALSVVLSLSFNLVIKVAVGVVSRSSERMNERNGLVDDISSNSQADNNDKTTLKGTEK